jgi:hypothetical protein
MSGIEAVGEGRAWAILSAQALIDEPKDTAMFHLISHAQEAAKIFDDRRYSDNGTQVQTCRQFASGSGEIIDTWQNDGTLPAPHEDFRRDLSARVLKGATRSYVLNNYDPSIPRLSSAVNRLRVVRLGLPEVLRSVRGKDTAIDRRLGELGTHLAEVCPPGVMTRNRPNGGYGYGYRSSAW